MKSKLAIIMSLIVVASVSACGGNKAANNTSAYVGETENLNPRVENGIYCPAVELRVSREDCEDLTREDAGLRPGAAAFNVPNPMRRGQTVTVELVIDRRSPALIRILESRARAVSMRSEGDMTDFPATNMTGDDTTTNTASANGDDGARNVISSETDDGLPTPGQIVNQLEGTAEIFSPLVGRHMRAELVGEGFDIVPRTEASQDIRLGGQATWVWEVTARQGGPRLLTVLTAAEGITNGRRFVLARATNPRTVTVDVSWQDRFWDGLTAAPNWIKAVTAVIVALGGLLTAWYALPWFKRRGSAKDARAKGKREDSEDSKDSGGDGGE